MAGVNTFAGGLLDRLAPRRTDEAWLAERLADPSSRAVIATSEGVLVRGGALPALVPLADVAGDGEPVLLGADEHGVIFAVDPGPERARALRPDAELRGLREVAAVASQADAGLLAHAAALLNWHRTHRFCANCGASTRMGDAGYVRVCTRCGMHHHPRTDPVVITLVIDGDRVLLGRQAAWPEGRYSALAGFVEPGESLEEAVMREIDEEAGVMVTGVRYVSSQPWPFPASLMLGFEATYAGGDAHTRDRELEDVRWFSRGEVERALREEGPLVLPPRLAIARRLIEGWLAVSGDDAPSRWVS
jgi:NAD+ diphosphatase